MPNFLNRSLLALLAGAASLGAAAPAYRVAGSIAGPDGSGWDYAQIDPGSHRLFVTHGDAVTVIDLPTGTARSIGQIARGHAAVPIAGTEVLVVTSGRDSTVRFLDIASGRETASVPVGENPDAAIVDPVDGHLLVMNAKGGSVSEIDVAAHRVVRTITVAPALEYAAIGRGRTLYVNNEDANEIETVNLVTGAVGKPIAMPGCEGPTGLAYDAPHDRLIAACGNGQAAIVAASARHLVQLVPIGMGPDAVMLDAKRKVALIPCGRDGVLEILSLATAGSVQRVGTVKTEVGARTGALDPSTGTVYLPTARFGPPTEPGKRPPALPGTFHFVVVRPQA